MRDGYTYYPEKLREWRFFSSALDIPPHIVVNDGSGDITMDAIDWLARHRVPLIRVRRDGRFSSIVTAGGQAANVTKVCCMTSVHHFTQTSDARAARIEGAER